LKTVFISDTFLLSQNMSESDIPTLPQAAGPDLICGVGKSLIEPFLYLIRDNYQLADRANLFIQKRAGITNLVGIANLRDTLSHLATAIQPGLPDEERISQRMHGEEHFRRAIFEPYETSLEDLETKFREPLGRYLSYVEPVKDRYDILRDAPNAVQVRAIMHDIDQLIETGRSGKSQNRQNEIWFEGITKLANAFDELSAFKGRIESYLHHYDQILRDEERQRLDLVSREQQQRTERRFSALHWTAIVIGVIGIAVAILAVVFAEDVAIWRRMLMK
jgi:hypothetical protein